MGPGRIGTGRVPNGRDGDRDGTGTHFPRDAGTHFLWDVGTGTHFLRDVGTGTAVQRPEFQINAYKMRE